ncbi:hypothetical protein J4714_14690 [Staphylococcus epidermidis]|nr:hypothetical protein [Staphylococcus epidermidis]
MPIALGILAASGQIDAAQLADYEFAGELSLTGALRPVRGALATALALQRQHRSVRLVLPPERARGRLCTDHRSLQRRAFARCGAAVHPHDSNGDAVDAETEQGWKKCRPGLRKPCSMPLICAKCVARSSQARS